MPSVQLQMYLQARADGATVSFACEQSGISIGEAVLHEADIERGELVLPPPSRARAREEANENEESEMETTETTISVNGGPEVPLSTVKKALDIVQGRDSDAKPATETGERLKRFIERAERLDEEIKDLNSDKSELFKEMKSDGFDTKAIKQIIKLRKMEPHVRQEAEAVLQTYMSAIGMTPIEAAIALAA